MSPEQKTAIQNLLREYINSVCWMFLYYDSLFQGEDSYSVPKKFQLSVVMSIVRCEVRLKRAGVSDKAISKILGMCWYVTKEVKMESLPDSYRSFIRNIIFQTPGSKTAEA